VNNVPKKVNSSFLEIYPSIIANTSAWQWWIAISPYNFKDGLVYIDKSETGGNVYDSKLLWALGNYSRFIRPGAKRVSVEIEETTVIKISAFKNVNGELVIVIINKAETAKNIQLNLPKGVAKMFETSEFKSLSSVKKVNPKKPFSVPKESISTLVIANN